MNLRLPAAAGHSDISGVVQAINVIYPKTIKYFCIRQFFDQFVIMIKDFIILDICANETVHQERTSGS